MYNHAECYAPSARCTEVALVVSSSSREEREKGKGRTSTQASAVYHRTREGGVARVQIMRRMTRHRQPPAFGLPSLHLARAGRRRALHVNGAPTLGPSTRVSPYRKSLTLRPFLGIRVSFAALIIIIIIIIVAVCSRHVVSNERNMTLGGEEGEGKESYYQMALKIRIVERAST